MYWECSFLFCEHPLNVRWKERLASTELGRKLPATERTERHGNRCFIPWIHFILFFRAQIFADLADLTEIFIRVWISAEWLWEPAQTDSTPSDNYFSSYRVLCVWRSWWVHYPSAKSLSSLFCPKSIQMIASNNLLNLRWHLRPEKES